MPVIDLQQGSRGMDVRVAQQLLNDAAPGGSRLDPDGIFGPLTFRSVKDFQRQCKLELDGVVGPSTWAALKGETAAKYAQNRSGQRGPTQHGAAPRGPAAASPIQPKSSPAPARADLSAAPSAAEPPLNPALDGLAQGGDSGTRHS